jgi:hypothetical protein
MKKGGAAKGELVLAIFELANCFRNGWGVAKDPVAARQYYETAANLGDTDAMNEAAWCYLEGFGGKKDRVKPLLRFISLFSHFTTTGSIGFSLVITRGCNGITNTASFSFTFLHGRTEKKKSFPTSSPHPDFYNHTDLSWASMLLPHFSFM